MNLSRPFVRRPVATTLFMVAIFLTGLVAFKFLPVSALPEVDYPTIQVQTFYPGASPDVISSTITAPLEQQFGQMSGLKQMSSVSAVGVSVLTLQFDLTLSLDVAEQQVQAAINAAGNTLPSDLPAPPIYAKVNPAETAILTLAVTSNTIPLTQVQDYVDTRLAQKISQVAGVGLVSLGGGNKPAVRVQANIKALAGYGINIDDLRTTISNANVNTPKGSFDGARRSYTISANDQVRSAEDYKEIIIAYKNGAAIRLKDVATIVDGAENSRLAAWANAVPAIIVDVQRQPGANVIAVADNVKKLLPDLKEAMPAGVDVAVMADRTTTIRASVADVEFELCLAVALVVAVIYLFLRSVPATIIPSLSVPLSLVGTFAVMYLAGFSINNLSLMALVIAAGFVVDDAIVMIENIARFNEKGGSPTEAALKGSKQIGFTIVSLTISLVAVLIPLLFMQEVVGRLFREFALTLAVTIMISAVVSLTLVPMMCAKLLKPEDKAAGKKENIVLSKAHAGFDWLLSHYDRTLKSVLNRQRETLWVFAGTLVLTFVLAFVIPKGFFPIQDTGVIRAVTVGDPALSFAAMSERQRAAADIILKDEDVENLTSFVGVDGSNHAPSTGRMIINLKPHTKRGASASEIIERLQKALGTVSGMTLYMQSVQDLTVDATVGRAAYQFFLEDSNSEELAVWAPKILEKMAALPEIRNVSSESTARGLSKMIIVHRDTAARLGITLATVDNALFDAFGQRNISTIFTQANQYRVILEAHPSMANLDAIRLPSSDGGQVPLSVIAEIVEQPIPLHVERLAQFPAATISFDLAEDMSLGEAVDAIEAELEALHLPTSMTSHFQGSTLAFRDSLMSELLLILAAVVTMYIVLGILYESFIHPLTILSTLPSAGVGALLALLLTGGEIDIVSIIGIILLIGIVKKNAIMMIDFALSAEREEGLSAREAIYKACLLRFRPIMMTTFSTVFGAMPLMLSMGVGAELRRPLGLTIIGGLLVSQVLTLYSTPVIYLAFDRLARRMKEKGWAVFAGDKEEP